MCGRLRVGKSLRPLAQAHGCQLSLAGNAFVFLKERGSETTAVITAQSLAIMGKVSPSLICPVPLLTPHDFVLHSQFGSFLSKRSEIMNLSRRLSSCTIAFEVFRNRVHAGPKPFGFTHGVATQTVGFVLSKPRTAPFDNRLLEVKIRQWVKA